MNRSLIVGLSVLVVAGLAALYLLVIRDTPATPTADQASPAPAASNTVRTGTRPSLQTGSAAPRLPPGDPVPPDSTEWNLHDNRGSGGDNVVVEGTGEDRRGRRLDAGLVRSIHRNAQAMVLNCANKVAPADRGPRPRVDLKLKVGITGGTLSVIEATPELEDMTGAEVEAARTCIRDLMMGTEVPTPAEADLASYDLHYRYVVK